MDSPQLLTEEDLLLQTRAMMGDVIAEAQLEFNGVARQLGVTPQWLMEKAVLYQETGEHFVHPEDPARFKDWILPTAFWRLYEIINSCVAPKRGTCLAYALTSSSL